MHRMLSKWLFVNRASLLPLISLRRINHRPDITIVQQMKLLNERQKYRELFAFFDDFTKERSIDQLPRGAITQVLKACGKVQDISRAINIHRCLPSEIINDPYILPSLIHVYMQCGDIRNAEILYNRCPEKSQPIYGAMMKGFIKNKQPKKAIDLFSCVKSPNEVILLILFNACAQAPSNEVLQLVKRVSSTMPSSYYENPVLITTLIDVLMKCGDVSSAVSLFNTVKNPTLYMYGALMKGYIKNNELKRAIDIFHRIPNPDEILLLLFFNACAEMKSTDVLPTVQKVYLTLSESHHANPSLMTSVIDAFMKSGDVPSAESLFDRINAKNVSIFGAMIKGYIENQQSNKAIDLFNRIHTPNDVILILFFNACAHIGSQELLPKINHLSSSMPRSFLSNSSLITSLIDALMKCGDISSAESFFNLTASKTLSMYGAVMKGYIIHNQPNKAIDLFRTVQHPSEIMYNLFFNACAQIQNEKALCLVKSMSTTLSKSSMTNTRLMTSLMDALIKCGDCQRAHEIFDKIERNAVTYANLMNGFNDQQQPEETIKLFYRMKHDGIEPDLSIYLLVIKALSRISIRRMCEEIVRQIPPSLLGETMVKNTLVAMWAKTGLIDRAKRIFDEMDSRDHYTYSSMIHGYGLQGMGSEALEMFHSMPSHLIDEVTYLCVLNACSHSGYVNQAKRIFDQIEIKSDKICTAMVDCLSRAAMFDEAKQVIDEYEKKHQPIYAMYMALLSGARNYKHDRLAEQVVNRMKQLFGDMKAALTSASILLANIYGSLGDVEKASDIYMELTRSGAKKTVGMSWTAPDGIVDKFRAHDRSHPRWKEIYEEIDRMSKELIDAGHRFDASYVTRGLYGDETVESVLCGHSEKLAIAWNFVVNPNVKHIEVTKNLRICPDCHQTTKILARLRKCEFTIRDANRRHEITLDGRCSCEEYF